MTFQMKFANPQVVGSTFKSYGKGGLKEFRIVRERTELACLEGGQNIYVVEEIEPTTPTEINT